MNIDTLAGEGTEVKGRFKETLGTATADPALGQDGLTDQALGRARQGFGALRDFARNQPVAPAAVAAAIGSPSSGVNVGRADMRGRPAGRETIATPPFARRRVAAARAKAGASAA